jgi:hypothetical protein
LQLVVVIALSLVHDQTTFWATDRCS